VAIYLKEEQSKKNQRTNERTQLPTQNVKACFLKSNSVSVALKNWSLQSLKDSGIAKVGVTWGGNCHTKKLPL